jgi:hypothetical protein
MRAVNVLMMILLARAITFPVVAAETELYTLDEFGTELDTMYRRLETDAYDLNAYTPKAELDRVRDRLRDGVGLPAAPGGSLTRFQVEQGLQLMAAAAHLGHARVEGVYADWAEYQKGGGRAFPLSLRLIAGRAYVAKNLSGQGRIRPGDEIVSLDGQPISRWLQRTRRHVSAESSYMADSILEYDFPMYLWVEAGEQPWFKLTMRRKNEPAFALELGRTMRALGKPTVRPVRGRVNCSMAP